MRVLVIGDLHLPADVKGYFSFCKDMQKKYRCNKTIFIGDILDNEAISFHDKNPELPGAAEELRLSSIKLKKWHDGFKEAEVIIGNHDARIFRKAFKTGIPTSYIKQYSEVYNTPKWKWRYDYVIDDVYYVHGDKWTGATPSFTAARSMMRSVVSGHSHSVCGINFIQGAQKTKRIFGMNVGSGVDESHPSMLYSAPHLKKAIISCGIIIDGQHPYIEVMN